MINLPDSWPRTTLTDVVDVLDSRRVPVSAKERLRRLGNVPYYGATGQVGYIDEALFNEPLVLLCFFPTPDVTSGTTEFASF